MISELVISKHQVFKFSNILQTGVLMKRRSWNAHRKRARNSSHAREFDFSVQSNLFLFTIEKLDSEQDASSDSNHLNQEDVAA